MENFKFGNLMTSINNTWHALFYVFYDCIRRLSSVMGQLLQISQKIHEIKLLLNMITRQAKERRSILD